MMNIRSLSLILCLVLGVIMTHVGAMQAQQQKITIKNETTDWKLEIDYGKKTAPFQRTLLAGKELSIDSTGLEVLMVSVYGKVYGLTSELRAKTLGLENIMTEIWKLFYENPHSDAYVTIKEKEALKIPYLGEKGIIIRCDSDAGLAEEAPIAYKDVDNVVQVVKDAGLSRRVARLKPLAVIKGG